MIKLGKPISQPLHRPLLIKLTVRVCAAGSTVSTFMWSETQNFLAAIKHEKLTIWYYPAVSFIDKELLDLTVEEKNVV